jgi:hypothetical protein
MTPKLVTDLHEAARTVANSVGDNESFMVGDSAYIRG